MNSVLKPVALILLICVPSIIFGQAIVKGKVIDKKTKKPLPFVHIILNQKKQGITTDIDGKFEFINNESIEFAKFSYIGYKQHLIAKENLIKIKEVVIELSEETVNLNEVTVYPGENPAHRIINEVLKNRKKHNPENLNSYSYRSYDKMYFTADLSEMQDTSSKSKLSKILKKQHLLLMESVTERKYKKPGKISEEVIASRVSGLKEPSMVMLATQLQSISFYDEVFTLLDSRYVNPISRGCTNRYFFNIEDTAFSASGDTIFRISYKPKKGRNFEGLMGVLNINSRGYAIQNVTAEPVEENGLFNVKIKQNYKIIENNQWFPVELHTDIVFNNVFNLQARNQFQMVGISKSYIEQVTIGEDYRNNEFSGIETNVTDEAFTRDEEVWKKYRTDSLSQKDIKTYEVIDSLGEEVNLDFKMKLMMTLSEGYIPYYFLDLDLISLLDYNTFEGYRPGIGFRTNEKFSKFISLGGYGAYGMQDEEWKYGGNISFNISDKNEIKFKLLYYKDVLESSGYSFYNGAGYFNNSEFFRTYNLKDLSYQTCYMASFEFRTLKNWNVNIFAGQFDRQNISDYYFTKNSLSFEPENIFSFQETGVKIKYAPSELKTYIAGKVFESSYYNSPVFHFNAIKGFNKNNSEMEYTKLEAMVDFNFLTKSFGRTSVKIVGGKVYGELPYFMLYNGHGDHLNFSFETPNTFATMKMNEFLSDQFVSFHYRQDLGNILFKSKKFRPEIVLCTSIGFGELKNKENHNNIEIRTMEKGYYESGVFINYLFRMYKFIGLGFGTYYRYGPYSYSNNSDNFAYKLSLTFKL